MQRKYFVNKKNQFYIIKGDYYNYIVLLFISFTPTHRIPTPTLLILEVTRPVVEWWRVLVVLVVDSASVGVLL